MPVCYRDRYAQCQTLHFGLVIDMPVIVHVKVVDITVVSHGPVQQTTEILQLQSIDKVFDVPVVQVQQILRVQAVRRQSRSHSCSSLNMDVVVDMPVVCNNRCRVVENAENCEGPAVAVHSDLVGFSP